MLKVYGRANSINVRKVLWMLGELNLPYEREDWGRGFRPTDEPAFRQINPVGVVPVIDDGDFRLRESNTIVRYLAEKHGRADLYPKDLRQRADVESWMDWASTEMAEGMRPVFHALVVKNPAFAGMVESAAKSWAGQMLVVNRWFSIDFPKPELKAVSAYYDRLTERPPYRAHGRNGTP